MDLSCLRVEVPVAESVRDYQLLQILVDDCHSIIEQKLLGAGEEDEVETHPRVVQSRHVVVLVYVRIEEVGLEGVVADGHLLEGD